MTARPGVPLPSGFRPCTPEERKRAELSPEARARVLAVMEESDRCCVRAAVDAQTAMVG